jgi:hypothetical protein
VSTDWRFKIKICNELINFRFLTQFTVETFTFNRARKFYAQISCQLPLIHWRESQGLTRTLSAMGFKIIDCQEVGGEKDSNPTNFLSVD